MNFKSFLLSKAFALNIVIAMVVTFVFLLIAMWGLRSYTEHGTSFAIPDFSGMNEEQVHRLAKEKELSYVVADSLYVRDVTPGIVIDQFPHAGFSVKKGRTVFLTVSSGKPEQLPMPSLTDISLRQAVNIMQHEGLNAGTISYIPSEYPNLVLAQQIDGKDIAPGVPVNRGSVVDLLVGRSGAGEKTVIPNLIGVTFEQASNELAALFLIKGSVIYDESVMTLGDTLRARIWQQRPVARQGQVVDQGVSVDIWLTVDEEKINRLGGYEQNTLPLPEGMEEQQVLTEQEYEQIEE